MTFNLCFYHQLWVKWVCIHTGNSSGYLRQTQLKFPECLWMFGSELNAHQIGILIIFSINDKLANMSSAPPPEVKRKRYCI